MGLPCSTTGGLAFPAEVAARTPGGVPLDPAASAGTGGDVGNPPEDTSRVVTGGADGGALDLPGPATTAADAVDAKDTDEGS